MALVWNKILFDETYTCNGWPYGVQGAKRVPRFHYNWFGQQNSIQQIVNQYLQLPGFAQVSDVAIIGGAFGWTSEILATNGINSVSVDTSPYVLATKDSSEEQELRDYLTALNWDPDALNNGPLGVRFMAPDYSNNWVNPWDYWLRPDGRKTSATVVDEDMSTNGSRRNVRQALGNNIDAIVTEFVIESVEAGDDAGSLTIIERCEQLRPNPSVAVIHMIISGGPEPLFNAKTIEEWRILLDTNGYNHTVVDMKTGTVLLSGG